jgi:hypothetical protein
MEIAMQSTQSDGPARDSRLRFIFDDAVASFGLAANATFEDIAEVLRSLTPRQYGSPLAIDVTVPGPSGSGNSE